MNRSTFQQVSFIPKLVGLWIALLILPFAERTLLGAKSYYFLYIGLGLAYASCVYPYRLEAYATLKPYTRCRA